MPLKVLMSNGNQYKSINPWDPEDTPEAWTGKVTDNKAKLVPIVYAAWQLRCKAMADLPFSIYRGNEKVDDSDGYKNVIKFLPDPYRFLWMCEGALAGMGRFYFFNEHNAAKTLSLKYWRPDTVTYEIDAPSWTVKKFIRDLGKGKVNYDPKDVLYCWLPDPDVEIGAPLSWPLKSALIAASSIQSINQFVSDYAGRGMTKMFLLAMKGNPSQAEKDKIQSWWNSFWRKAADTIRWMVFNADSITPTVIGSGLDEFRGTEINTDLQIQVLTAMGVPASLILADSATFATAQQDVRTFYQNTVLPDARIIQASVNTQVMGEYRLEFEPERLETFQTDETERAGALSTLVDILIQALPAGQALTLSMNILGYDLTDEQEKILAAGIAEMAKAKETPEEKTAADLLKWQRKAVKHIGKDVAFNSDIIPAELAKKIHSGLPLCKTEDDVRDVFSAPLPKHNDATPSDLIEMMRLGVKALQSETIDA